MKSFKHLKSTLAVLLFIAVTANIAWATKKTSHGAIDNHRASILKPKSYDLSNFSPSTSNIRQNIDYLSEGGTGRKLCSYLRFQELKTTFSYCLPIINKIDNSCFISIFYAYDGKEDKYSANVRYNEVAYFALKRLKNPDADIIAHIYSVTANDSGQCSNRKKISSIKLRNFVGAECVIKENGSNYCGEWW